ncbi:MAG: hypothetical protein ACKVUS_04130 [Saprospiraceae bacterium]
MRKILLPISLAALLWSACSKSEFPSGGFENPVFRTGFEADPPVSWTAGEGGAYLFTRVEQGEGNVLVMSGAFADAGCPMGDCPGSMRFEFRNEWPESFVRPDSIFKAGKSWTYKSPFDDSLSLHTVALQWVMPDGAVFRSDILPQPQDSSGTSPHFNILHSEPWEKNERDEATWKMDVSFSCWLFDTVHQKERKILGSGVIAVGYR